MGKYRRKSLNQQTIIKQYNITNNNYYINNEDINSNDKKEVLDNANNNVQNNNYSSDRTVNKSLNNKKDNTNTTKNKIAQKKDTISKILPIAFYIIIFTLYSLDVDTTRFSNILLIFSSAYSFVMEADAWIEFKNKNKVLGWIQKVFGPLITTVYIFIIIALICVYTEVIDKIPTNTVSLIIMLICIILYSIRNYQQLLLNDDNKNNKI